MKPDWKDAPEWAEWLAMDGDGEWNWYEYEPFWASDYSFWVAITHGSKKQLACKGTAAPVLEKRPEAK